MGIPKYNFFILEAANKGAFVGRKKYGLCKTCFPAIGAIQDLHTAGSPLRYDQLDFLFWRRKKNIWTLSENLFILQSN